MQLSTLGHMPCSAPSGFASASARHRGTALIGPLGLQVLHKQGQSLGQVAKEIWNNEGWRGLFKGNGINIVRSAPFRAVNFACFDFYKKALIGLTGNTKSAHTEGFVAGALSGEATASEKYSVMCRLLLFSRIPRHGQHDHSCSRKHTYSFVQPQMQCGCPCVQESLPA